MSEILNFIKRLAIGTSETTNFANSADVVLDHYNKVLNEVLPETLTNEVIERYYTYYSAYTKLCAIMDTVNNSWSTKDTYPIPYDEYKAKAEQTGASFLKGSVGIDAKTWETPEEDDFESEYDDEWYGDTL